MTHTTDIDLDVKDRNTLLAGIDHIPALANNENTKHVVGVYFQNIPTNPYSGTASMSHPVAEKHGYFKIDFLNNSVYRNIESNSEIDKYLNQTPDWGMLQDAIIVEKLPHLRNYFWLLTMKKPASMNELAMTLALIRPAKKHLQQSSWSQISKTIWDKPRDKTLYYFKKPHAYSYAGLIVLKLNLIRAGKA